MKLHWIAGIAFAGICTLCATTAFAEEKVAVMKLDSLGSNTDEQAAMVLEAVRNEVMKSSLSLDSNGSDITYTEMQMVTGCDKDASIGCYDAACETLGAPAIIFGSVEDGGETKLIWYVSGKGIFREISGKVSDKQSAEKLARDIVIGEVGKLVVTSNVEGALIFVDDKQVAVSVNPKSKPEPIELVTGSYIVKVRKPGFNREDPVKVDIEPDQTREVHFDMTVATDPTVFRKAFKIAGWTTLGVGAASLVAGGVMAYFVNDWQNDLTNAIFSDRDGKKATDINNKGKKGAIAVDVLFGVGGFLAATGVALVCVGYLYDFTGEKADAELMGNSYMPKIDFQLSPEYQGMTMGWTF